MFDIILLLILCFGPLIYILSPKVQYVCYMVTLYLLILLTTFLALFPNVTRPFDIRNHRWVFNIFMWLTRRWSQVTWEVRGKEILDKFEGPCLVVANHQSSIDLLGMAYVWPTRGACMAKRSLQYAGFFGLAAGLCDSIFVDRFDREKARATLAAAEQKILDKNMMLWIFAEGTRNHDGGMLPFKKGAFHMAVNCQVPVIPVVFSDYGPFYNKPERRIQRGHGIIQVLEPISTEGLTGDDVHKLSVDVREKMFDTFEKISPEAADVCKRIQQVDSHNWY